MGVEERVVELDPAQAEVERRLDALAGPAGRPGRWGRRAAPSGGGVYLWGGPGRGKTVLMDRFAARTTVPVVRLHFLDFLIELNRRIGATLVGRAAREPGAAVRDAVLGLMGSARALCLDELHLHDGADARYLASALMLLLDRGVLIVATSNYRPDDLLPDPLFHRHALPVIELIRARLTVIELTGDIDYRVSGAHPGGLTGPERAVAGVPFGEACGRPRSPAQLRALVRGCGAGGLRIEAVPALDAADPEAARRFADLMDLAFDARVQVWISSTVPRGALLDSTAAVRDGDRLRSRLGALSAI